MRSVLYSETAATSYGRATMRSNNAKHSVFGNTCGVTQRFAFLLLRWMVCVCRDLSHVVLRKLRPPQVRRRYRGSRFVDRRGEGATMRSVLYSETAATSYGRILCQITQRFVLLRLHCVWQDNTGSFLKYISFVARLRVSMRGATMRTALCLKLTNMQRFALLCIELERTSLTTGRRYGGATIRSVMCF